METPPVPERVLREAIVNAVCRRDYSMNNPIQVIRYSSRIELRNAGHALVDEEERRATRSSSRNPRLASALLWALRRARAPAPGSCTREMNEIDRPRPSSELSRPRQEFAVTFLLSQPFDEGQQRWLGGVETRSGLLPRAQRLALVLRRASTRGWARARPPMVLGDDSGVDQQHEGSESVTMG